MIKQAKDVPIIAYKPVSNYTRRGNLQLVDLDSLTKSRDIASKAAYETSLMKALENKKFWDELLEKLRKSGGGGGGSRKIDKILTSLMFANFLSNKTIQAILKNFNLEFLKLTKNISSQPLGINQNPIVIGLQKVGTVVFNQVINMISLITSRDAATLRLYDITRRVSILAGMISFQLNKLKEVLEEELKELITKLDVKEKIRKVKDFLLNILQDCTVFLQ